MIPIKFGTIIKSSAISTSHLDKINALTRRTFSSDDIFSFSLILCDNEVDRDFEQFSIPSLDSLASLFIGKSGIFDHISSAKNQTARIFDTSVVSQPDKLNSLGQPYTYLLAHAYMVRSPKNLDLILDIDAGIKKEVSVGCAVDSIICSICNTNLKSSCCSHSLGSFYNDKLCFAILNDPSDAYEFSFVAVPAQVNAGIIKSFDSNSSCNYIDLNIIPAELKSLFSSNNSNKSSVSISFDQLNSLKNFISHISHLASVGISYRDKLKSDVAKLAFLSNNSSASNLFKSVSDSLTIDQLTLFKSMLSSSLPSSPQIPFSPSPSPAPTTTNSDSLKQFSI